ncbi:anaerobic ribonucleoside-triphosphate reductase activating protein [Saliterribacillus persicus]|uniref:Anaerobic ribonucleoside-triphosphate reductase-activating protein n=1 Tax=Saliterribacillus persicus TaxID=930114 RepID=A0A368XYU4_9BACI|nr:anaerobic ribonucleoside-triphosphate reductase activating protein [Saliterribacillus persicus]RCW73171.1 ribonucleoside-triphosphate reductase class III activase subunit [Saliterribacillus persicus]
MKVMNIIHDSVVDGPNLRTVIFFAGCPHFCKGCHNPASWNIKNGTEMTKAEILAEVERNPLTDITLSGGEPFFQAKEVSELTKDIKKLGKNIWIYSGYTIKELLATKDRYYLEMLENADTLVDGKFMLDKRDLTLHFRGSSNQKVIDLHEFQSEIATLKTDLDYR